MQRLLPAVDVTVKLVAIGFFLWPLLDPNAPQYAGKAMLIRAALWPWATLLVPAWWLLAGRPRPYPFLADILIVVPVLLDAAGNVFGLFGARYFDVLPHLLGWFAVAAFVGLAIGPIVRSRWVTVGLCIGVGAVVAICWEITEFVLWKNGASGLQLGYEDTIQDLTMSLLGSVLGGLVVGAVAQPTAATPREPFGWSQEPPVPEGANG